MNRDELLGLAHEHVAQASALLRQVEPGEDRECLIEAQSKLASAGRRIGRCTGGTPARVPADPPSGS